MNVIDLLKKHEGFRSRVYRCTANKETIGYGYNLDANPLHLTVFELDRLKNKGIAEKTAENLLIDQVYKIKFELDKEIHWWLKINQTRRDVLIDMAYNLGVGGLMQLKKILDKIEEGDYSQASIAMLDSKWSKQVHGRANELSEMMRTGSYRG